MILTAHLLVGAAIGSKIHIFWAVSIIALASHFFLDSLPHWEYHPGLKDGTIPKRNIFSFVIKLTIDFAVGLFLVIFFSWHSPNLIFVVLGAFVSILPDGFIFLHFALKTFFRREPLAIKKIRDFHHLVHRPTNKNPKKLGALIEFASILLALYFIIF